MLYLKRFVTMYSVNNVLVVGGGFIGLEMADMLNEMDIKITLLEAGPQVMTVLDPDMAAFVHMYLKHQDIDVILNNRPIS